MFVFFGRYINRGFFVLFASLARMFEMFILGVDDFLGFVLCVVNVVCVFLLFIFK